MVPWRQLTKEQRNARGRWAAHEMRSLPERERNNLIAVADNVIDARAVFAERAKLAALFRTGRFPFKPDGAA